MKLNKIGNFIMRSIAGTGAGRLLFGALMIGALVIAAPAAAVDWSDWEYEPGEGLHQEEWYDPSDWFDRPGEGISYENDWWNYSYRGHYGYNGSYGYYEPYSYTQGPYEYDYYTDRWDREDEGLFDF